MLMTAERLSVLPDPMTAQPPPPSRVEPISHVLHDRSLPIPNARGSKRLLRFTDVSAGEAECDGAHDEPEQTVHVPEAADGVQLSERAAARPWKLRTRRAGGVEGSGARERRRFSVALASEEIEEDIYAVTGSLPRRRPRRRARVVQQQLDTLFPGLWLTEITAELYKVPE